VTTPQYPSECTAVPSTQSWLFELAGRFTDKSIRAPRLKHSPLDLWTDIYSKGNKPFFMRMSVGELTGNSGFVVIYSNYWFEKHCSKWKQGGKNPLGFPGPTTQCCSSFSFFPHTSRSTMGWLPKNFSIRPREICRTYKFKLWTRLEPGQGWQSSSITLGWRKSGPLSTTTLFTSSVSHSESKLWHCSYIFCWCLSRKTKLSSSPKFQLEIVVRKGVPLLPRTKHEMEMSFIWPPTHSPMSPQACTVDNGDSHWVEVFHWAASPTYIQH